MLSYRERSRRSIAYHPFRRELHIENRGISRHGGIGRLERPIDVLALIVLALVVVSSIARPLFYWDSWAYHLPFSAILWNIGDAARGFVLSPEMRVRYDGFPLLAEFVQGALWRAAGTVNATALINSAALCAFVIAARMSLRPSVAVLVFGSLGVPMLALHSVSNYIDLFVAVCICIQVLAAVAIAAPNAEAARGHTSLRWVAVYVAAAAAAGNSKITGLMLSFAISGFVVVYLVLRRREFDRKRLGRVVLAVMLGAALGAATNVRNAHVFSNPLYPFDVHVAGVHLVGPEGEYRNYPDYTERLGVFSRPANWFLSITEIDWAVRGVAADYTLDSAVGDKPQRFGPARTGGYWGALIIASLLLAIALAVLAARRNRPGLARDAFFLTLFAYLSVVTAFLPQSHELRYYLHWPLLLMLVVAALARAAGLSAKARVSLAAAYLGAFLASQAMLNFPLRVWPVFTQADSVAMQTRAEGAPTPDEVRSRGAVCLGPEFNPRQFAYAAVFHGGSYVVEQGWLRCARYPPYEKEKLR